MKKIISIFSILISFSLATSCGKERANPKEEKLIDLSGVWIGEGYQCPSGVTHVEKINITHDLQTGKVVAIKTVGDDCVTTGNKTFDGIFDGKSLSFKVTFVTGNATNPNSSTTTSSIDIINSKLMEALFEGIVFTKEFKTDLPPCPCSYEDILIQGEKKQGEGNWCKSGRISTTFGDFHHGATYEARWIPNNSGEPGQQCTYLDDNSKSLITSGIAAGSPDIVSPGGCSLLSGDWSLNHKNHDVNPWKTIPCWKYLEKWAANNINNCNMKTISGIKHMTVLAGNMTCEDVTLLIKVINNPSFNNSQELINYINGNSNQSPLNLKEKLEQIVKNIDCSKWNNECNVLKNAIRNL